MITELAKNTVNGYIGGHVVRLILKVSAINKDKTRNEIARYNSKLLSKTFNITVFNFNPQTISYSNDYGWAAPQGIEGMISSKIKQFKKSNNVRGVVLKGTIFPKGFFGLDNILINYITSDNPEQDLKDLDFLGGVGCYFSILEIKTENKLANLGSWYITKLNYDKSCFMYASNAKKIDFNLELEEASEGGELDASFLNPMETI